ncbi:MAG TPA: hypothetical protein VGC41_07615 [Kofleriaceae bacterium]
MSNESFLMTAAKLRAAVALVDEEVARDGASPALRAAWSSLVTTLAVPEEMKTRVCPNCGGVGMAGAKICSKCWNKLTPIVETV